ncbi:type VI secretion system baseplate subunit TssG [Desulfonema magnum]|uniref:Type VI secretion protein domain-containing protein, TssG-like n=1 Tax=Desulfonema magnum TaxID=45655 RepID=A0A975BI89_9BACT|nr:type VI secretion system baseplate subunit TssG [Desulfonema magnum]QTA85803.1 Type VI secretion protein domain-containing protein, TssG-like [Desulfonema magnum]
MGTHGWGTDVSLEELLFDKGYRFDFYQAARLLEAMYSEVSPGYPKKPLGEGAEPGKESVRFKSKVGFDFPASEIDEIIRANGKPAQMTVNFMGLAGGLGPLPAPYTELILERAWRKDTALRDFLDIFNHRLISLMYRVRKIYRIGFDFKAPEQSHFSRYFFSLMGMGMKSLRGRMGLPDRALLFYTELLNQQPRSMTGLESVLSDYFKVMVRGNQLCGRWIHIEEDEITRLGASGQNRTLGQDAVLGSRVWDQQGKFELMIGPLTYEQFLDFLPTGSAYVPLCEFTRFYIGTDELDYDFLLILKKDEKVEAGLGKADGPRLSWTSWLKRGGSDTEYERVRLSPQLEDESERI